MARESSDLDRQALCGFAFSKSFARLAICFGVCYRSPGAEEPMRRRNQPTASANRAAALAEAAGFTYSGIVCRGCHQPIALITYQSQTLLAFRCPSCKHSWHSEDRPSETTH